MLEVMKSATLLKLAAYLFELHYSNTLKTPGVTFLNKMTYCQ